MNKLINHEIGVIVGRFQVPELHPGHIELIKEVCARHDGKVVIFVGVTPVLGTKENPLDFKTRKAMIQEAFVDHDITILPLMDMSSDEVWSRSIDNQIRAIHPIGRVCVYGGRDSFLKSYCGSFDAHEFPTHDYRPGSEVRFKVGRHVINHKYFRAGAIYSTQNQYKRTFITIDVAIYKRDAKQIHILMGKKFNESKIRLIGGFVEGESLEETVRREAQEEANVALEGPVEFIGSYLINDWRYRNTSDSILTSLFASEITWGGSVSDNEEAGDDLQSVHWLTLREIYDNRITGVVGNHIMLVEKVAEYFKLPKKGV